MSRPLRTIAADIRATWPNVYYGAEPYLSAMSRMGNVEDGYGHDSGKDVVIRFLSNAKTWRGDDARRIKAELKRMI